MKAIVLAVGLPVRSWWICPAFVLGLIQALFAQELFDQEYTRYHQTEAQDPIARLQHRLDQGTVELEFDPAFGYLTALLQQVNVPPSSELLVFSKTSFQRERISPKTPRAIYFSENIYVAWIPGSPRLEVSAVDPGLGAIFYTLEQRKISRPKFIRCDQCLECHTSSKTLGVPGYLIRSYSTDEQGLVDLATGRSLVTHATPLEQRWGGWYVCGRHGDQTHLGNLIGREAFDRHRWDPNFSGNITELSRFLDLSPYPQGTSDIVALMVLEHQAHMQNLITRLHYDSLQNGTNESSKSSSRRTVAEAFLRYLLFVDEAPLSSPIEGVSEFVCQFESQGPTDHRGRSLRQFDLKSRLFKFPCSYMIYSEAFESLPRPVKLYLYGRLWKILTGADDEPAFAQIPPQTKQAILEILKETKPKLPRYWTIED